MNQNIATDSIWNFSVKIYTDDDVKQACLTLQDTCNCDVLILLCCLFAACTGKPSLAPEAMEQGMSLLASWREDVIRPLRTVRKQMKNDHYNIEARAKYALRARIAAIELDAERLALETLEPYFKGNTQVDLESVVATARDNLQLYARLNRLHTQYTKEPFEIMLAALARQMSH